MEDWVKIYTANKKYKIELIKGMLAENGIKSSEISSRDSSFLLGSIDLYVHPKDEEKARKLLKEHNDK